MRMTVLASGSKGNSTIVASSSTRILVDAGLSCRETFKRMKAAGEDPEQLDAVVISHEHSDHINGLAVLAKKLGIPVGQVITSQYFRAIETGRLLGFGEPQATADVSEGGQVVTPIENNRRTAALRKLAATAVPGTNVVVVSHKPNIVDAFGKDWFDIREAEISIFKPDGAGGYRLVVRVQADEWAKLAQ